MARPLVILDACVLINLVASGEFDSLADSEERAFAICSKVKEESIFLRPTDAGTGRPEPIAVDSLVEAHRLRVLVIENGTEEILFVNYAARLDDGEAMSLALAESRELALATDDLKARRLFGESVALPDRLLSTSELIRDWADVQGISAPRLRSVLLRIMSRARFSPARSDPNFAWWHDSAR